MSEQASEYAQFIKALPQANIPFEGVQAFMLSAPQAQAVFFELPAGAEVPPHSHCAQWGIVVEGELELTIGGFTKVYRKGDSYHIADGEEHSGRIFTSCLVIDVFDDPARYQAK